MVMYRTRAWMAQAGSRWRKMGRSVGGGPAWIRQVTAVLSLAGVVLLAPGALAGLSQPGMILAGTVYNDAGDVLTDGALTLTYAPDGAGETVVITASLEEITGPAGLLSYAVMVPLETALPDSPVASNALPVTSASVAYTRTLAVVGTGISRTDSVTVSASSIGAIERVDVPKEQTTEGFHSGDTNQDYRFSLLELLREIELFTATDNHEYHCDAWGEDGYDLGLGSQDCTPHSGDYEDPAWQLSLDELLRMIELFSGTGHHEYCLDPQGIDGFRVGNCSEKSAVPATKSLGVDYSALVMRRSIAAADAAMDVTISFNGAGAVGVTAMGLEEWLPDGWAFGGIVGGDAPAVSPTPGVLGLLEFAWFPTPLEAGSFTYRLRAADSGLGGIASGLYGESVYRIAGLRDTLRIPVVEEMLPVMADSDETAPQAGSSVEPPGDADADNVSNDIQEATDSNVDGLPDRLDTGAGDIADGKGTPDYADTDADGDGVVDDVDEAYGGSAEDLLNSTPVPMARLPIALAVLLAGCVALRALRRS